MDSGFYAACAALMARSQALDLVANNLANTSTPGYRAQQNIFRSFLAAASGHPGSRLNQAVNDFGISGGSQMDLTQGNLEHTGNDLDFAVQGPGFFEVKTATGLAFTRNGNFQVSAKGQLTTAQGDPVMGEQGPIRIVGGPVTVSADGTISVSGAVAGKIKLVEFPPGTALESIGKTYYSAPAKEWSTGKTIHHHTRFAGEFECKPRGRRGGTRRRAALRGNDATGARDVSLGIQSHCN